MDTTQRVADPAPAQAAPAEADEQGPVAEPAELSIPAIDVQDRLIGLRLNGDGSMEVPEGDQFDLPGWYEPGPRPGEDGNAVIAGHVDSSEGPSIFASLHRLEPGDEIAVRDTDDDVVTFAVDRVEIHDKDQLPAQEIFDPAEDPSLVLITCGGEFDETERSYEQNVVVFTDHAEGG